MKKIYTLVSLALLAGTSFGQSINRPYEFKATEKHAPNAITTVDGRNVMNQDRATYYSEDFDAMTILDGSQGWTAALQSGNVAFSLTNTGPANTAGSSFVIPALISNSPTQWILLDSDSDGASGADEDATLKSDVIDLTVGGTVTVGPATPLKLEFEQFFAEWESGNNYDTLYIGITDDGGVTWNEVQISNGVGREGRANPEIISLNITPYALDVTQLQIRFRWDGNWAYGWQIDNVSIADLPPNDIMATAVFRGDIVNAYMYSKVPQSQATEFVIGVVARNVGFNNQTDIGFDWTITDPASGTTSGSSTSNLALLANAEQDTIWVSTGVTPTSLGNYTIDFTVTSDQVDDEPANNFKSDAYYELTTDIYGADYGSVKTSFYNWSDNNNAEASIGTNFSIIANGVIGAIDAELDNDVRVVDQLIKYTIYKYNAGSDEYSYVAETDEYTTITSDQGSFVRLLFDNVITVTAGELYLACAGHLGGDPSAGFVMAGQVPAGQVAGYNESGTSPDLISSLANPSAAAVRLVMIDYSGVEENINSEGVSIYPNPTNSNINIELTYSNSENTLINVMDITGKVVKAIDLGIVNGTETVSIPLEGLSNGIYFVEVVSSMSKEVKKFVKK
jgi:hypothetical protein